MTDYEVDGTAREKACYKESPITHLAIVKPSQVWESKKIIAMIKNKNEEHNFWSYVYKNGKKHKDTKIKVEVIDDKIKGKYLRTQADPTDENNLLELPIWHYGQNGWKKCLNQ